VVVSIAAFTFGIDRASVWGWLDPRTLALVVGGLLGLLAFVIVETRALYPLLDLSLFRIRTFSVMTAAGSIGNGATTIIIFLSMVFLQEVEGLDPIEAGTAFVTFSLGYAVASLASGRMQQTPPWVAMSCGLALGGLATLLMASTASVGLFVAFAGLSGLGLGFVWAYTSVVTQSVVPKEKAGAASGTVLTVLISAGGIALAIAISIYESYTGEGCPNQTAVIKAILGSAGIAALVAAAAVALFGRSRTSDT
ncbi:MAG: MFS transporter, partial [Pseudomonadota bacterium]